VRPLPPVWRRALWVAAVATLLWAAVVALMPLRMDMNELPMWLSWGGSVLELLVGLGLVCLALREAIPGSGVPRGTVTAAVATGMVLQILVGLATWMHSPGMRLDSVLAGGFGCLKHDCAMALPAFVVTLWLVFRALPLRASVAGLVGGAGAGVTADAILHLLCPVSDLRHVLMWHTGAIVLLMLVGLVIGKVWELVRWRR
jgi:hypothetical protein